MERKLRMKCKSFGPKLLVTLVLMHVSTMAVAHKANNERLDAMDARMQRVERVANSEALVNLLGPAVLPGGVAPRLSHVFSPIWWW